MIRLRYAALAAVMCAPLAGAQQVTIVDRGPGGSARSLARALALPHRLVEPDTAWFILHRASEVASGLVVLGRTAAIEGTVRGDVVVVGGDLFVRPGARIAGRAVAIGGGVYPSTLALIAGGQESHRDNTFTITRVSGGYQLAYQSWYEDATPPLIFPGIYGVRLPAYDRVNGLSVPFGPTLTIAGGRGSVTALATWRSDLGKVDPSLAAELQATRRLRFSAEAGRGTFSNEEWIWPDWLNSASVLVFGTDTRNYYRADRAQVSAHRLWETATAELEPVVGVRVERSWAVGSRPGARQAPWSLLGRSDSVEGMLRANPQVPSLHLRSVLAGTKLRWKAGDVRLDAATLGEFGNGPSMPRSFAQFTSDLDVGFFTFGEQAYELEVHWVTTPAGAVPLQRFAYLGGSGTMPFLDLLAQGGDELLLVDQRYSIPVPGVRLGVLGSPTLQLRHRVGGAGVPRLPALEQVIGVGVHVALVRAELQMDPASRDMRLSFGFTFSR